MGLNVAARKPAGGPLFGRAANCRACEGYSYFVVPCGCVGRSGAAAPGCPACCGLGSVVQTCALCRGRGR